MVTDLSLGDSNKYKLIAFDLDGVLVEVKSSWEFIHDYFGVPREERTRNYLDYVSGKISYDEWIKRDVALWSKVLGRKLMREDLYEAISKIPVNRDTEYVVRELKRKGFIVGIISAGVGQVAEMVALKYGFDFWIANPITFTEEGIVSENQRARMPPYRKPLTLLWIAKRYGVNVNATIYVGDSDWDIGVIRLAGCGIAYNCSTSLEREADKKIDFIRDIVFIVDEC